MTKDERASLPPGPEFKYGGYTVQLEPEHGRTGRWRVVDDENYYGLIAAADPINGDPEVHFAAHFPGARIEDDVVHTGIHDIRIHCEVAGVQPLGSGQSASLYFRVLGGPFGGRRPSRRSRIARSGRGPRNRTSLRRRQSTGRIHARRAPGSEGRCVHEGR